MYRVLILQEVNQKLMRFIDIDSFTLVYSFTASGAISSLSFTSGYFESRVAYFMLHNLDSKGAELYRTGFDYCLVPGQNPCLQCISGRYLDGTSLNNKCLKSSEFPAQYGPNGYYIGVCLGDLNKGCLMCLTAASTCTLCDNANGFYLYTSDGICY